MWWMFFNTHKAIIQEDLTPPLLLPFKIWIHILNKFLKIIRKRSSFSASLFEISRDHLTGSEMCLFSHLVCLFLISRTHWSAKFKRAVSMKLLFPYLAWCMRWETYVLDLRLGSHGPSVRWSFLGGVFGEGTTTFLSYSRRCTHLYYQIVDLEDIFFSNC